MENQLDPTHPDVQGGAKSTPEASVLVHGDSAPGRLNGAGPVAIIDIGSNSVRLVVYERLGRAATPLFNEKELCGLARGLAARGKLQSAAIRETLTAIRRFVALAERLPVSALHVLATAAVREAANGAEFIAAAEEAAQARVVVLSGSQEARLSALGVVSGFRRPDGVAADLGGGSLEVSEVSDNDVGIGETFPLGVIRLEEEAAGSPKRAEKIAANLVGRSKVLRAGRNRNFYAIGGTWRSLARLHMGQHGYPLRVMHHYVVEPEEMAQFCHTVARSDLAALDSIDIVSRARRALLPYGAAIMAQVIKAMKPSSIVMSALGVREGLLYDLLDGREKSRDPLIVACEELAYLRSRSPRHVRELIPWTGTALQAIGLDETAGEERLRRAACLLSDIGWRAHPEYRGSQSMDMIANSSLIGVDHPGRAYLALTSFYQHEGPVEEALSPRIRELVSSRMMKRARALGAALRVGHIISAAMPGILGRTRVEQRGEELALVLPRDLAALGGARVERRLGQIAKMAGRSPVIVVE